MATAGTGALLLEVATPTGLKLATHVDSVEARSVDGYFGVMPGHQPMLAALQGGLLKYVEGGTEKVAAIGAGFVEVEPDVVRVLSDAFALPGDVDEAAAQKESAEVNEQMRSFPDDTTHATYQELAKKFAWLEAQLEVAKLSK